MALSSDGAKRMLATGDTKSNAAAIKKFLSQLVRSLLVSYDCVTWSHLSRVTQTSSKDSPTAGAKASSKAKKAAKPEKAKPARGSKAATAEQLPAAARRRLAPSSLPQYAPVGLFFLPKHSEHPLRKLGRVGGQEAGEGEEVVEFCYPAQDVGHLLGCKNHRLMTRSLAKNYWYVPHVARRPADAINAHSLVVRALVSLYHYLARNVPCIRLRPCGT